MTRITTVANQKGGVGKTTTALCLSMGLTHLNHRILAVDADPQGNLSYSMGANVKGVAGLYEGLKKEKVAEQLIQNTQLGDVLPSTQQLSVADLQFREANREYLLSTLLESIRDNYSHIIIDTPPTLGILTVNALTVSQDVIIPMTANFYSLQGFSQLLDTIHRVQKYCNPNIKIAGLLITRWGGRRTILQRDLKDIIVTKATELDTIVFKTVIREGIAVEESQIKQVSLFDYAKRSKPAKLAFDSD